MIDLEGVRTLADIPSAQARKNRDHVAIKYEGRETSYGALESKANQIAQRLLAAGVQPSDRVSILSKNHDGYYALLFGSAMARTCFAPINFRLTPQEIRFIVSDAAPRFLFVGEDLFDVAIAAVAELDNAPTLIALYGEDTRLTSMEDWLAGSADTRPDVQPELDDDLLQLYTSGTTGLPKGVVLTNYNYRCFLEKAVDVDGFSYDDGDSVLVVMPLFHVAGTNVSFSGLAQGSRLVLVKDFHPVDAIQLMQKERIGHAFLAPAMIQMVLQQPETQEGGYPALKSISYGASPIAEDVLRRARATFGCKFVQFYGMTESAGAGTYLSPSAHDLTGKLSSCGEAWPGTDCAIVDADGKVLGVGEIGEIVLRSETMMKSYWNRPEATSEALVDGWLHTGDVGYRDADGFFFVHDRIKDMIVSGGENIYPAEVESAIMGCPGVLDVAIIGVPDEKWGESVKALIVPAEGEAVEPAQIIAWARQRIASYKCPKSVDFIAILPRNPSGKILRRELRQPYWEGRTRSVG
jgi:acyl-CoA synthetase (AMP-forming)/AMP-acid ligase II